MFIFMLGAASVMAQTATTAAQDTAGFPKPTIRIGDVAAMAPISITGFASPESTVAGAPYSAETVTERVQQLPDGNRIQQRSTGSVSRDGKGRLRREEALPVMAQNAGAAPHLVLIEDPVAGVHWTLDEHTKTAIKMPFLGIKDRSGKIMPPPPPPPADKQVFFAYGDVATANGVQIAMQNINQSEANVTKTALGKQTIEGVVADGTRITRTIPAGSVGNELPIIITTETWYSPDLKVMVMTKTNDPRMGETTYRLTNIQRAEPSADLFQVPDDYTIDDTPGKNFVYRTDTKKQ